MQISLRQLEEDELQNTGLALDEQYSEFPSSQPTRHHNHNQTPQIAQYPEYHETPQAPQYPTTPQHPYHPERESPGYPEGNTKILNLMKYPPC